MANIIGPGGYLAEAKNAEGAITTAMDCRSCSNAAYLLYKASGQSAIFTLQASHDATGWLNALTVTATATQTGSAQVAAFYPYVRVTVNKVYTGTGGANGSTAYLWVHYTPVLV